MSGQTGYNQEVSSQVDLRSIKSFDHLPITSQFNYHTVPYRTKQNVRNKALNISRKNTVSVHYRARPITVTVSIGLTAGSGQRTILLM